MSYNIPKAQADQIASVVAAQDTEVTDFVMPFIMVGFVPITGTWTASYGGAFTGFVVNRTVGAGLTMLGLQCCVPKRTAASRGVKPTGVLVKYAVSVAAALDVQFILYRTKLNGNGVNTTNTTLGGDVDGDYDVDHNTAIERGFTPGAVTHHAARITLSAQDWLAGDENVHLVALVTSDLGGTTVFSIQGAELLYTALYTDAV